VDIGVEGATFPVAILVVVTEELVHGLGLSLREGLVVF